MGGAIDVPGDENKMEWKIAYLRLGTGGDIDGGDD